MKVRDQWAPSAVSAAGPIGREREPEGARLFSVSHFFSPYKYLIGFKLPTHVFNTIVVWMITIFLYVSLYFDLFRQAKDWFGQKIYSELFGSIFDKNEKL